MGDTVDLNIERKVRSNCPSVDMTPEDVLRIALKDLLENKTGLDHTPTKAVVLLIDPSPTELPQTVIYAANLSHAETVTLFTMCQRNAILNWEEA